MHYIEVYCLQLNCSFSIMFNFDEESRNDLFFFFYGSLHYKELPVPTWNLKLCRLKTKSLINITDIILKSRSTLKVRAESGKNPINSWHFKRHFKKKKALEAATPCQEDCLTLKETTGTPGWEAAGTLWRAAEARGGRRPGRVNLSQAGP